jgi:hypothetical protein
MKIGPLNFSIGRRFAETKTKPALGELGAAGTNLWRGLVFEEYLTDLRGRKAFETYDRMLRGDGQVQAVELAVTLPIRAAAWTVEPATGDDSSAGREAADLIQSNLVGGMTITWDEVLRHALLGALMGVTLFEKVWEIRDGLAAWRKLAPRHPKTILRWEADIGGGIQGIVQAITDINSNYREIPIPIEKLIRLTWREDYGNPEGRALLRPAYKHWYFKDFLYKTVNIAIDRFGVGTPLGRLPVGWTEEDKQALLQIVNDYKSSESAGFVLPPGYELTLLESQLRLQGIQAYLEHQDVMISRSVLAQFVNLGTTASGSRALGEAQSRFFVMILDAIADWFAERINRYAIPQWMGYNYPGLKVHPQLTHTGMDTVLDPAGIANGLAQLTTSHLLTPDDDVENTVRGWFGLPELPEDHQRAVNQPLDETDQSGGGAQTATDHPFRMGDRRYDPHPHVARGRELARDESRFEAAMKQVLEEQHNRLLDKLRPIIEDFRAADASAKGRHISRMQAVVVPLVGKYQKMLEGWLWDLFSTARDRAASEFGAKPTPVSDVLRQWIAAKAQVLAQDHAEKLRASVLHTLLDMIRRELPTADMLKVLNEVARGRAGVDLTDGLRAAGEELVDLVNGALIAAQK